MKKIKRDKKIKENKQNTSCNSQTPDKTMENKIAGEFAMDDGVTLDAPYKNIARQSMVEYYSEEDKNEKNLINSQGS